MTVTEISKELKCMYNYVWQVAKAGGYTGKKQETIEVVVPDDLVAQPVAEEQEAKEQAPKKRRRTKTA